MADTSDETPTRGAQTERVERMRRLIEQGYTLASIAELEQVSPQAVQQFMRRHGLRTKISEALAVRK